MAEHLVVEFHEQSCHLYHFVEAKGASLVLGQVVLVQLPHPVAAPEVEAALLENPLSPETPARPQDIGVQDAPEQDNAQVIRAALDNAGIKIDRAVALVPKQWATLRLVRLPSSDPDEIDEMARFEAERHIPFNAERHIVDYFALDIDEIEGARLLLAAIDAPPADRIAAIIKGASLQLQSIDISTLGLANVLQRLHPAGEGEACVQVHTARDTTDILILLSGIPIFARSVAFGSDRLGEISTSEDSDGPNPVQRLLREVRRTLDYAQREFECPPLSRAYISGPPDVCTLCAQAIQENLGLVAEHLRFNAPLLLRDESRLLFDKAPGTVSGQAAPAIGALIGLLDPEAPGVDLTPPSYRHAVERRKKQKTFALGAIIAAVALLAFFLSIHTVLQSRASRLKQLEAEVAASKAQADQILDMRSVVNIISRNTQREGSALAILDTMSEWEDLFERDDMRIAITDFLFDADQNVKISGHALTYADLNTFVSRLTTCGHFRLAMIQDQPMSSAPNVNSRQVVKFTVYCYFKEDRSSSL